MKRVLTIQDISCLGKCSLTAALPVLSAMGMEAVILPTAILSAHTEFKGAYVRDLTEIIEPVTKHWKEQGITFDSLSCGYFGSASQMALVKQVFAEFKSDGTRVVIDPVMGDYGRLYTGFDMEFVEQMRSFCREADVLLPNLTEAAYLLGIDYAALPQDRTGYEKLVRELAKLNEGIVVLKGIQLEKDRIGVLACDAHTGEIIFCERDYLDAKLSGTGDIFAAVCQGAFTRGMGLSEAVELAMDFVLECMKKTLEDKNHRWYGVNFEEALPYLYDRR
ncbi:MAG: pyridoxamine kinase [Lachnospiraceae bacterium]|nr:pyridoxamine kinase [Lachnospiraceae bacterium]